MKLEIKKLIQFLEIESPFKGIVKQEDFKNWFMKTNKFLSVGTPQLIGAAIAAGIKIEVKKGQEIVKYGVKKPVKKTKEEIILEKKLEELKKSDLKYLLSVKSMRQLQEHYHCCFRRLKKIMDGFEIDNSNWRERNSPKIPSKQELLNNYIQFNTEENVAKFYKVNEKCVRKWFRKYKITRKVMFEEIQKRLMMISKENQKYEC